MFGNRLSAAVRLGLTVIAFTSLCGSTRPPTLAAAETPANPAPSFAPISAESTLTPPARPDEPRVPERFRLGTEPFPVRTRVLYDHARIRKHDVTFPSPVVTTSVPNNTVHAEYFQPAGPGPYPAVIVLHILGGDFPLSRTVANYLAQNGVAALFVKMPYYGPRRDPASPRRMISKTPPETVEGMTQAVLDIRRAADFLASRPEVNAERLGITGISLGGIMSALAGSIDARFARVGIVLGGGKLGDAVWDLDHREAREFREQWLASGKTRAEFVQMIEQVDPATYGHRLKDRRVLMIEAAHDEVIPPENARALHAAIGDHARLIWLDSGHYTAIWYLPREIVRLERFFNAR
jgi:dienelactone hydrolase